MGKKIMAYFNTTVVQIAKTSFICTFCILLTFCKSGEVDKDTLLLYGRASKAYSEGRFAETSQMLSSVKSFPPALVLRGKAQYFSNNIDEAEKSLRKALSLRPSSAEASIYLARLLKDKNKISEAESIVESLISDDPSNIRALRHAAELSLSKGQSGEKTAISFLDQAVEASSETALVFLDRARLRWISGNAQGALDDLKSAKTLITWQSPLLRSIQNLENTIMEAIK